MGGGERYFNDAFSDFFALFVTDKSCQGLKDHLGKTYIKRHMYQNQISLIFAILFRSLFIESSSKHRKIIFLIPTKLCL